MIIGLTTAITGLASRNTLPFLTKADGSPITKADNNLLLKGI